MLDFVPFKTVDAMVSGGGSPTARPPAPAPLPQPAAPAAQPAPKPVPPPPLAKPEPEPEPRETVKETPKEISKDPDSLEPAKEHKHKVDVSTTLVKRKPEDLTQSKARADAEARESAAEARRQRRGGHRQAVREIQSGLSGGTRIELKGPGGGGLPYANRRRPSKASMMRPGFCRPASRRIPQPRR